MLRKGRGNLKENCPLPCTPTCIQNPHQNPDLHRHVSRQGEKGGANACSWGAKCTHVCPASIRHTHAHTCIWELHGHKCTHTHIESFSSEGSKAMGKGHQLWGRLPDGKGKTPDPSPMCSSAFTLTVGAAMGVPLSLGLTGSQLSH